MRCQRPRLRRRCGAKSAQLRLANGEQILSKMPVNQHLIAARSAANKRYL